MLKKGLTLTKRNFYEVMNIHSPPSGRFAGFVNNFPRISLACLGNNCGTLRNHCTKPGKRPDAGQCSDFLCYHDQIDGTLYEKQRQNNKEPNLGDKSCFAPFDFGVCLQIEAHYFIVIAPYYDIAFDKLSDGR